MKDFILDVVQEAGKLLKTNYENKKILEFKKENNQTDFTQILTEQDLIIENYITNRISTQFPTTNIISEEKDINDFSIKKPNWVLDPIDGTMNYYRGLNLYSISLAYWDDSSPKFGAVHCPFNGDTYFAEKGKGATLNNEAISVSNIFNLDESIILLSGYNSFKRFNNLETFNNLVSSIKNFRVLSTSVLDVCYIASGKCDGRVFAYCKFWDIAAVKLILEEAGGRLSDWRGDDENVFSPLMIASNNYLHKTLINLCK